MNTKMNNSRELRTRSLTKAITYRILILILDFSTIYLLTGKVEISLGFTMVSNIYTSVAYYAHERIWNKTNWGRKNPSAA